MKEKVIFTTANLDSDRGHLIKQTGCRCLQKPFRIVELLNVVNEALVRLGGDRGGDKGGPMDGTGARWSGLGSFAIPIVLLFLLITITQDPSTEKVDSSEGCKGCHQKVYTEALSKPFLHSVVQEKCATCHIEQNPVKDEKVIRSSGYQREFLFVLGGLLKEASYRVKVLTHDRSLRGAPPIILNFSPGEINDQAPDKPSFTPVVPVIDGVKVEELKIGVFAQATISWTTNVYTTSVLEYGSTPEYGERTSSGDSYGLTHRATLVGLRHGTSYHYRAIARDIWGNVRRSKDHILDTTLATEGGKRRDEDKGEPILDGLKVFKTEDGLVLLHGRASKLSRVVLKVQELIKEGKEHGMGFLPERYTKIDVCVKCHPQGISHPVGIRSKGPDIKTPDKLPTMPGGVITCVTCHLPHGGEKEYFARMDFERDICIDCHIKEVFL
jgi:predicted CXXCH cytochrome family protein